MKKTLKNKVTMIMAVISLWAMPLAPVALVGCTGGCASVAEGHDPIVVNAERLAAGAFELMDAFTQMEFNNREELRKAAPAIEQAANHVRVEGKAALESLRAATQAYKQNRTPENKANVETWIATVEKLRDIARTHLTARR